MQDNLREYFARVADDDLGMHGLETMSLCAALQMAAQHASRSRQEIGPILNRWVNRARHDRPITEYRRFQPLLEELLGEVERGRLDALNPDEATLLFATGALLKLLPAGEYYDFVRARLEPHQEALSKRVGGNPPDPNLATLAERCILLCPLDLALAPTRDVRKLAGIPINFRGTVVTVPAKVKFIGSIPDHTMLVVEDGACCIEGFVLGMAATRGDCLVQENIGGMVVSREGDIHARKLIDRATVVAKWGSVHCQGTAAPELVFAGRRILIEGDATRGQYRAHEIQVNGRALGGVLAVTGQAQAERFVNSDRYETAIILRRALDATDYGEEIDMSARRMLARAARLRRREHSASELSQSLATEVNQDAHTVLLFLASGDDVMGSIQELERTQRRLTALNRVILGLHQLSSEVEDSEYGTPWERSEEAKQDSVDDDLIAIIDEIRSLESGQADDKPFLEQEMSQLEHFRTQMRQLRSNRLVVVSLLAEWRTRLQHWLAERDRLLLRIQQAHQGMESALQRFGHAQNQKEPLASVKHLRAVLADEALLARERDLQQRANSQFVRMMRRSINARLDRLRELRLESRQMRNDFERVQEELRATVRLRTPWDDDTTQQARVTGRFDAGVRLCTNQLTLDTDDAPDSVRLILTSPREEVTSFMRTDTGIVEVE